MKLLLLSRYSKLGASSRVRFLQYLPFIQSKGWKIDVSPLFTDRYLQALYSSQSLITQVIGGYWRRLRALLLAKRYDLIWIEKEAFPFMPVLAERLLINTGIPYVVDYDDALFHRYDQHRNPFVRMILKDKIDWVMKHSTLVVAGNEYLANRARTAGARWVEIIPTVVDLQQYHCVSSTSHRTTVIGWIGSPATSLYLKTISPVIQSFAKEHDVRFVAVGADKQTVGKLPVDIRPWSEETEVQSIQSFDIGIMPLVDSLWERGKCGYKLIQYMACGKPVVASPVGANKDIVEHGVIGFLAASTDDWLKALKVLSEDPELRKKMGAAGRKKVQQTYNLKITSPELSSLFKRAKERK